MPIVNIHDAKSGLSRLVGAIENGEEKEIIIAREGKPVARLVPLSGTDVSRRIGFARAVFGDRPPISLEALNAADEEIAALFGIKGSREPR